MRQVVESDDMRIVRIGPNETLTVFKKDQTYEGPSADALVNLDAMLELFPRCRRIGPLMYLFWR